VNTVEVIPNPFHSYQNL